MINDTRYACSYWRQHCDNFKEMLTKLMTEESLLIILKVAKETTLSFNAQIQALKEEENNFVRTIYENIEKLVLPPRNFDQDEQQANNNVLGLTAGKQLLFDLFSHFFEILDENKNNQGAFMRDIFFENKDLLEDTLKKIVPAEADMHRAVKLFMPQLITYITYIFYKYDETLEGKSVPSYFDDFNRQRVNIYHFITFLSNKITDFE